MEIELGRQGQPWLVLHRDGLFLGRTALIERRAQGYAVRAPTDLERLLARAYGAEVAVDRVMPGFRAVAAALAERNLCRDFDYWPDEGCQAVLDRIEREWIAAGDDPNLAEPICWFAPRRDRPAPQADYPNEGV